MLNKRFLDWNFVEFWWGKYIVEYPEFPSFNKIFETFLAILQRHLTAEYLFSTEIFALGILYIRHLYVKLIDL